MRAVLEGIALFLGLCAGFITAGGTFALITVVGIVPRMAGKTHTGRVIRLYESAIIWGGSLGNICSLFDITFGMQAWMLPIFGLSAGMFVGCLVMALAKTLNVLPIFFLRLRVTQGESFQLVALGLGKFVGAMIYFLWL